MRDDGENDAGEQQQRYGRHDQTQSRQHEHVEAVVKSELRIGGTKALRIEHEQDFGPVRVELCTEDQAYDQRDDHGHATGVSGTHALAYFDGVALDTDGGAIGCVRTRPNRQGCGYEADTGKQQRIGDPQTDPGAQLRPYHTLETKLVVPHDIGDELRQCEKQADDDGQGQNYADENLVAARCSFSGAVGTPGNTRTGRTFRRHARTGPRSGVAIGLDIEDDRIIIRGTLPVGTVRTFRRIEQGAKHIEERHVSSLQTGKERVSEPE